MKKCVKNIVFSGDNLCREPNSTRTDIEIPGLIRGRSFVDLRIQGIWALSPKKNFLHRLLRWILCNDTQPHSCNNEHAEPF